MLSSAGKNSSRYTATHSADDGSYAAFEVLCKPRAIGAVPMKSCSPPYHIHTSQEETFRVIKGSFGFRFDGRDSGMHGGDPPLTVNRTVSSHMVECQA